MPIRFTPFDAAEFLDTEEAREEFVAAAFETGEPAYIAKALGTVARSRGMTDLAREAGVTRQGLYKALGGEGDPRLSTLIAVARALGYQLTVRRLPAE